MTDSFGGPSRAVQLEDGSEEHGAPSLNVSDIQNSRQGHYRTESISSTESHSSDDGIEWENPGYSSEYASDDDNDGYRSDEEDEYEESDREYEQQDTQRLLSSSNTRIGGLGMGMRVGETGTGTTIGLEFEQDTRQNGEDYDALPLTSVDQRSRRYPNRRERIPKRSGRKDDRRSAQTFMPSMIRLGDLQTEQEKLIAKRQLRIKMFWNVFYVFAWYGCSTSLSFYNKWLFSPRHYNFRFPLFTTCLHMIAQFVLSSLTLTLIPSLRPSSAPTPKDFGTKIMPCAVASGLDVGLSNNSLKSITLAFYTMCKSSSLAFVLLFAFAFKLERPTWTLAGIIGVICIGLFMMVMSEVDFALVGFIQVMLASVLGGLRWSLTQLLLERTDTKSGSLANPISTIFFLSPIMGICLCIVAGLFEGYGNIFSSEFFQSAGSSLGTLGLLFLGGVFAFAMVLAEFNLIARTSVVSLSVLGIIKEVVTIVISSLVFHDQLTIINILGLFITLSGIGFYHFMKLRELKAKARKTAKEIVELHLASSTNRVDGSVDRMRAYETRRKRRSHKSRPGYQGIREGTLDNNLSAERRESTIDELPRHATIRSDGSDPPNKDDPLMLGLDSASPIAPPIGL
ncbi:Triose-phosphate Transporter [Entomortierella chlamydospora]|uniref:Triose-phosphate Transporter n=1 Tax=Entomortierella chlamydospora TaxID=101097 RepID=A0A9P6T096_9FUNG|nr:Triose-phosphate Transporter [Entomortierella chlamydospora]